MFKKRENVAEIEEGRYLARKFDKSGLIPVITTDVQNGGILMHGYMNEEALKKQLKLGKFTIGAGLENLYGAKEKKAALFKK